MQKKLAIVTTHPIQYNAPLFILLAQRNSIQLKVFYTWGKQVLENKFDPGFGKNINWDIPLLEGYDYCFVENSSTNPGSQHRKGIINPTLIKKIESWEPNAILVYGWNFVSHTRAITYFNGKIPVLFRGDSTLLDPQHPLKAFLKKLYLTRLFKKIDIALYAGSENKKYFKHYGIDEKRLVFMPHAIDHTFFAPVPHAAIDFRKQLGISKDERVLLFAGKFIGKKNPIALLNVFTALNFPNVHLVMAGNGPLESQLKQRASGNSNIHFLPFQNQSAMPSLYAMCDAFILPSKGPGETWGLAVNEAMAAGKAVIVSNKCGCAADLVQDNVNGFTFDASAEEDMSKKIAEIFSGNSSLQIMGNHSLDIIKNWSLQNAARAIEKTLTGL